MNDTGAREVCEEVRAHYSALRDGQTTPDARYSAHLDGCSECRESVDAADAATRYLLLRGPIGPSMVEAALTVWDHQAARSVDAMVRVGRWLLASAALACATVAVLALSSDAAHSHLGYPTTRDSFPLEMALAIGMAFAAWRPERFLIGFTPVLTCIVAINVTMSVVDLLEDRLRITAEVAHLPWLVALAGALLCSQRVQIHATNRHRRHLRAM